MGTWTFPGMRKKIMPLSLLHKRRRKWMGRREKSGASPADGHSRNAGTPPPRAGRAAAQGTARPGGRAPQASRPTGPGGPVCRPYKNAETCPMNAVGAGPRPARGRGTPQGGFSCPCGAIHLQPLPYGSQETLPGLGRGGPWASRRDLHRERWLGKARRRNEAALALIFHKPRAQWPGGNLGTHSDFARRKDSACSKG